MKIYYQTKCCSITIAKIAVRGDRFCLISWKLSLISADMKNRTCHLYVISYLRHSIAIKGT